MFSSLIFFLFSIPSFYSHFPSFYSHFSTCFTQQANATTKGGLEGGGLGGGGLVIEGADNHVITHTSFINNSVGGVGGGLLLITSK